MTETPNITKLKVTNRNVFKIHSPADDLEIAIEIYIFHVSLAYII